MERVNNNNVKLFSLETYNALTESIAKAAASGDQDAKDDLRMLKRATDSWHGYVNVVDATETRIKVATFRCEGEEYRELVELADRERRRSHDAAISFVSMINRLCPLYSVPDKVFLGDTNDREEVADFCLDVAVTLFAEAKKGI